MPEDAFRQLRRAIDELDLPESLADPWRWRLEKMGMPRAAVCAELCLLLASRKIKHVSLRLSVLNDFLAIGHILFETPNWSGRFDQVQSVSVAPPSDIRQLDLYNLAYLFKMPNLRRFEILGCEEHYLGRSEGWNSQGQLEANLGPWRLVQDSRVETIVIREGAIRHCAVNVLLNACQAVKYLHVEVDLLKSEWDLFQFFRLEDALCRHAESLEYLAIVQNQKNKERQGESGFRHSGCLSFLPRLDNLRSAVVPLRALTSIPDIGSIEVASSEDASPGELSNEAEIRQYLPPSPERISICNDNVHYGSTTHLFGLG
ncbi:hypothetical protein SLS60_003899 [Paraconiothyrium brasiliense]|uniref:Uncharacterized protein n=1 Tax=Paraconiothyrium brasiliense TaxID=300254 RepID=A0ABR3RQU1_9PLEO